MAFEAERAQWAGCRAWLRGELGLAVERLEAALRARPGAPDALYALARALSERGERDRALLAITEAISRDPRGEAGPLFRAIILHDHEGGPEAREALAQLADRNVIARSLGSILAARGSGKGPVTIAIPRPARWIADVAGRLLGLVEERLLASDLTELLSFHHALLVIEGAPSTDPLQEAFAAQRHETVVEIHRRTAKAGDKADESAALHFAFSLIALEKGQESTSLLAEMAGRHPSEADVHFFEGVSHVRFGRSREASWSFARASRLADIDLDRILMELAPKAGVTIQIVD